MNLFTPSESAHWYYPDGKPCHQVPMKSKPDEMRSTTVGDARKLGLLPSVTSILRLLDRPQLNAWKQSQAVIAALTLPRLSGETDDQFAERVVKDAESIAMHAANKGVLIHHALEQFLVTGTKAADPLVAALVEPFYDWANKNILEVHLCETTLIAEQGFAGRLDLKAAFAGLGLRYADYKSRKPYNGKLRAYPEDSYQLGAYRLADRGNCGCISVFINNQEPAEPTVHDWGVEEMLQADSVFNHTFEIWKIVKNYTPQTK